MNALYRKELMLAAIFLIAISTPLLDMVFKLDPLPRLSENRGPAELPPIQFKKKMIQEFPLKFTQYYNDNFGFRNTFVRVNYLVRKGLLESSPSREVVLGKDGWLFYAGEGELADYRGINHYDVKSLEKWARFLELKRQWLAQDGIRYLFVIAPNKSTIYGDYLPKSINKVKQKSGLDELLEYLKENTQVEIVDLRPALFKAGEIERTFNKTDTHWNNFGAFVAYQEIMKPVSRWFPETKAYPYEKFSLHRKKGLGGDLASLIGGTEYILEDELHLAPLVQRRAKVSEKDESPQGPFSMAQTNAKLPRVIVYRDSFLVSVIPYLSEHFQYSRYFWQRWDAAVPIEKVVGKYKPDLVIEEVVERLLKNSVPDYLRNYPMFLNNYYKSQFANTDFVYRLDNTSIYAGNSFVDYTLTNSTMNIRVVGNDPQLVFKEVPFDNKGNHIIKLAINSSIDTQLQLFYRTGKDTDFSGDKSITVNMNKGDNVSYLPVNEEALSRTFRLDPSTGPGEFVLKELEIRHVSE